FAKTGFCTAIRGAEGGGKVEKLPTHVFTSDDGDLDAERPTEIGITDRREFELSNQGFLPLCHYKNTDYAVFFGGQTTQKPKKYDRPEGTPNAAISARPACTGAPPRRFRPGCRTPWRPAGSPITSRSWDATRSAASWKPATSRPGS